MSRLKFSDELNMFYLRPVRTSDVNERYLKWMNDSEVNRYLEVRHEVQTLQSIVNYVRSMQLQADQYFFAICMQDGDDHVGNAKIGPIHPHHSTADLSLFIGEKRLWGQGLASRVLSVLTAFSFETLRLNKLSAGCYQRNEASARAFEKCGFRREALLRDQVLLEGQPHDVVLIGMTRRDYQKRVSPASEPLPIREVIWDGLKIA